MIQLRERVIKRRTAGVVLLTGLMLSVAAYFCWNAIQQSPKMEYESFSGRAAIFISSEDERHYLPIDMLTDRTEIGHYGLDEYGIARVYISVEPVAPWRLNPNKLRFGVLRRVSVQFMESGLGRFYKEQYSGTAYEAHQDGRGQAVIDCFLLTGMLDHFTHDEYKQLVVQPAVHSAVFRTEGDVWAISISIGYIVFGIFAIGLIVLSAVMFIVRSSRATRGLCRDCAFPKGAQLECAECGAVFHSYTDPVR